jgi:ABC-type Na+ transport system ATPase subunit NatA
VRMEELQIGFRDEQELRIGLVLQSWQYSTISSYSKGMNQRVLIAAALMHDPKQLIFDEPLSGLDVVSSRLFKDLLQELADLGQRHPLYFGRPGGGREDLQSGDCNCEREDLGGCSTF